MTPGAAAALRVGLRERLPDMVAALGRLVGVESPSSDVAALRRCAGAVGELGSGLLHRAPETIEREGRPHLRWPARGPVRVALLGHFDTVWPVGTLAGRPFAVRDGVARGPGVFDMKAGIVQGLFALAALGSSEEVEVLLTSDEETGSASSRADIEDLARRSAAVLVLEPSQDGALKTARKGVGLYRVRCLGRAAHAGLEPERGVNALAELARVTLDVAALSDPGRGTTVTPTLATAGSAVNVVPAEATLDIDVRIAEATEQERVDRALRALRPEAAGARLEVTGGPNRPPLSARASRALYGLAREVAGELGMEPPGEVAVGGASDGNFTAALGTPTLDGLGAVGGGAHAADEHVAVHAMPDRAALVAMLVDRLLGTGTGVAG